MTTADRRPRWRPGTTGSGGWTPNTGPGSLWSPRPASTGSSRWFAAPDPDAPSTSDVFGSAPRELARQISLYQTVELVRTTIDVVETQIDEVMPRADRPILHAAIVQYSREVAFCAAEIYARAAELRGAWDERLEALVVDAVLRGETDDTVLSRASTLGWHSTATRRGGGRAGARPGTGPALESIRHTAAIAGTDMLGAVQGDRMVVVLGGPALEHRRAAEAVVGRFVHALRARGRSWSGPRSIT